LLADPGHGFFLLLLNDLNIQFVPHRKHITCRLLVTTFYFLRVTDALGPTPQVIVPGVRRSGLEADHDLLSSVEVKDDGAVAILPYTLP
jgi:hypothetical protein